MHKIGRFIVYDAISVITQNVFYGFARPSESGERGGGSSPPYFGRIRSKSFSLKKALDWYSPTGFFDLPTALFCSNSSRYLLNLLPEKREDKKGLKLVCTFKQKIAVG